MVVQTDTHQKVIGVSTKRFCNGYSRESGIKVGFVLWTKTSRVSEVLSSSRVITSYHSSLDTCPSRRHSCFYKKTVAEDKSRSLQTSAYLWVLTASTLSSIAPQAGLVKLSQHDARIEKRVYDHNSKPLPREMKLIHARKELESIFAFWDHSFYVKGVRWGDPLVLPQLPWPRELAVRNILRSSQRCKKAPGRLTDQLSRKYPWKSIVAPGDP